MAYGDVVQAIAQFEGFFKPGSIASMNNNPGNIMYGSFAQSNGAYGPDLKGFAIFPTVDTGFSAADQLVSNYASKGYTLKQMIEAWAPGNAPGNTPQSTANYVSFVSSSLGVSPDTKVADLGSGATTSAGGSSTGVFSMGNIASLMFDPFSNLARLAILVLGIAFIIVGILALTKSSDTVDSLVAGAVKAGGLAAI